jgi:aconitate hydratase
MGVLPLQFSGEDSVEGLGLTGSEVISIHGLNDHIKPGDEVEVIAEKETGERIQFPALVRLDTDMEIVYYRNGGILHTVLRNMLDE